MAEAAGIPVEDLGLFTDLYQLTMAQSYLEHDKNRPATFSLIVRQYPPAHAYLVAAGLTTVLEYLEQVRFSPDALMYLRQTGRFSEAFVAHLATWRFQGDVVAIPEGSVFFLNEPVLEVTAPTAVHLYRQDHEKKLNQATHPGNTTGVGKGRARGTAMQRKRLLLILLLLSLIAAGLTSMSIRNWSGNEPYIIRLSGNIEVTHVEASFKIAGHVAKRLVSEGETVAQGAVVALLDNADLVSEVAMRRAELSAAHANLAEFEAGYRPEEVEEAQAVVQKAEALLQELLTGSRPQEIAATEATVAKAAVESLTLRVAEGEIYGLVGPDGAGKTTTMRLLTAIMDARKAWVIDMAGLKKHRHSRTAILSGGWKQRLALGCAMLHEPPIIFLDEPTSGVDPISRRQFWDLIYELTGQGVTVFYFPAVLLSGFMFPIANMPQVVQWLTYLNPLRYFLVIIRGIFLKGVGPGVLWPHMVALAVMGLLTLWLAAQRFHKTLA